MSAHPQLDASTEHTALRSVIAALGDGLLVLDAERRVQLINACGEEILGLRAGVVVGQGIDDLALRWNLRDRGPFAVSKMRHHLLRGIPYRNDDAFVVAESGITHVSLVMTPMRRDDQQVGAVICLRDITGLKLTEARLRESEARLRRIFRAAPTGMVRFTSDGTIADCNDAFESMLGAEDDRLPGRSAAQLWCPEDADASQTLVREVLDGHRTSWQGELRFQHADGSAVWTNASMARVLGVGPDESFAVAVVEDATERRRLEIQLRHVQKLESVGRLAAGLAHEFNTPVQFMSDNVRFLRDAIATLTNALREPRPEPGTPEAAELDFLGGEVGAAVDETLDGLERVAGIVRAMKSFERAGGGQREPVDVNEVVRTALVIASSELRHVANVEIHCDEAPLVPAWRNDLNEVVFHLLVNAVHAIGDRGDASGVLGTIRVSTRALEGAVEIAVSDTGVGIPDAIRDRVFDPFFTTKSVGRGTGQGLALAHNVVVERHGGTLTYETQFGVGTTFRVRLPHGGQ